MSIALPVIPTAPAPVPPHAPDEARQPGRLADSHGRTIRDLRLSITDRCNFRCRYCMEPDDRYMPKMQLLTLDEYLTVARVAVGLGVRKIRITGGEPTLYPQLLDLIRALAALGVDDLAMTTNGSLMTPGAARAWKDAGLQRITLSMDSLRDERLRHITRAKTGVAETVHAIEAAHAAGLTPVKVNAVVMRGVNDDEVADFADFARDHDVDMRLIEFMPLDSGHRWDRSIVVGADEMLTAIRAQHELVPESDDPADSTSLNFRFADGSPGRLGVIAPVTRSFCGACSRLRVTADGKVRPCLFSHEEWDLRPLLRSGAGDAALRDFIVDAVWTKQAGHGISASDFVQPVRTMSAIGG